MKTLGIIGLVVAVMSLLFLSVFNNPIDYEAAIGWGIISVFYLIAISIVGITKK